MSREPRRDEYTICTALAPEAVFTVRTYATDRRLRTPISAHIRPVPAATAPKHGTPLNNLVILAQVRYHRGADSRKPCWS